MSYFHVRPTALRAQSCELHQAYSSMCAAVAELGPVIRALQAMSCYDGTAQALRRISRRGEEQYTKLRQCAQALDRTAELYSRAEQRNLEGGSGPVRVARLELGGAPAGMAQEFRAWQAGPEPAAMLPFAEELFGTKVLVGHTGE